MRMAISSMLVELANDLKWHYGTEPCGVITTDKQEIYDNIAESLLRIADMAAKIENEK